MMTSLVRAHAGRAAALGLALFVLAGCDEKPEKQGPAPSRFDAPKAPKQTSAAAEKAQASFCEVTYPASGDKVKKWTPPPSRPVPKAASGSEVSAPKPEPGWRWINLWASWCQPCVAEIPLLIRWQTTLQKEGIPVSFEMWSVDSTEADLAKALDRKFPGEVHWLRSDDDLPALFDALGVDKSSAIPVHALVDPAGNLRCVRVGSVGEELYGTIKTIVSGS